MNKDEENMHHNVWLNKHTQKRKTNKKEKERVACDTVPLRTVVGVCACASVCMCVYVCCVCVCMDGWGILTACEETRMREAAHGGANPAKLYASVDAEAGLRNNACMYNVIQYNVTLYNIA